MAKITFLGGEETGDVAFVDWPGTGGTFRFRLNQPVECDDKHIIAKATGNRFFAVQNDGVHDGEIIAPRDRMANARAAKAAKRAAEQEDAA